MLRPRGNPVSYVHPITIGASGPSTFNREGEQRQIEMRSPTKRTLSQLLPELVALIGLNGGPVEELSWPSADTEVLAFALVEVVPIYELDKP